MAKLLHLSLPKPHRPKASLCKSCMALMLLAVAGCGANSNMMDQMMNSNFQFCPNVDQLTPDSPPPIHADEQGHYPVPVPGQWTEV